jgi:exosome complex component RRP40
MNGKIWIKAKSVKQTIALARAISISEHMNKEEMNKLCRKFVDRQAGF